MHLVQFFWPLFLLHCIHSCTYEVPVVVHNVFMAQMYELGKKHQFVVCT